MNLPWEVFGDVFALLEFEVAVEEFVAELLAFLGFFAGEEGGDDEVAGGFEGFGGGVGFGEFGLLAEDGEFGILGVLEDFSQIRNGLSIERCSLIATEMENSAETN